VIKRKIKLALSLLLCLSLVLAPLSVAAAGAQEVTATFNTETGVLTVTGSGLVNTLHTLALVDDDGTVYGFPNVFVAGGSFTATSTPGLDLTPGSYTLSLVRITFVDPHYFIDEDWDLVAPTITTTALTGTEGEALAPLVGTPGENFVPLPTWSIVSGSLPAGLTLNPDGTFSGVPTESGSFTVTVRHGNNQAVFGVEQVITITIADAETSPPPTEPPPTAPPPTAPPPTAPPPTAPPPTAPPPTAPPPTAPPPTAPPPTAPPPTAPPPTAPPSGGGGNGGGGYDDGSGNGGGGGGTVATPRPSPSPTPAATPAPAADDIFRRFTATDADTGLAVELNYSDVELPADFLTDMMHRNILNAIFLLDEMQEFADEAVPALIRVYVGDLWLTDEELIMFVGFEIDPETGEYEVIRGWFGTSRSYFYFEFDGDGIFGAMFYERPMPLLRFTIDDVHYYHNGLPMTSDVAPFISADRTMVPIRIIAEALGATPHWDDATRTAYIYNGDVTLRLPMGVPIPGGLGTPEIRNDRVLVPARFVIENFDAVTLWNAALREVTVYVW
jgi:hypothetical protein